MGNRYSRIARYVGEHPWAILPQYLDVIIDILEFRAAGGHLTTEEIQARIGGAPKTAEPARVGRVAVLPLHGVLSQRMNMCTEISGGTSTERFGQQVQEALSDPEVDALALDIDSPGGSVNGIEELAQTIYQARKGDKPIVGVANSLAASGAYWVGSQADQLVVTPGGRVGSIGVYAAHVDVSKAEEQEGRKTTLVSAGKYKTVGNSFEPLTDDARGVMQVAVDEAYDLFLKAVARGRGVKVTEVRNGYGEGRVLGAQSALKEGMVDRIETLSDVMKRLSSPQGRRAMKQSSGHETTIVTPQELETATGQELPKRDLWADVLQVELDTL